MPVFYYSYVKTPVGWLETKATEDEIHSIWFVDECQTDVASNALADRAAIQLTEYLNQQRKAFDLPLAVGKGTDFQKRVWSTLTTIPFGVTWSYAQLADALNQPKAVRAVGTANSKNPFTIVVPCHRVIGKNGNLTGYAGGLARKAWLLKLEHAV